MKQMLFVGIAALALALPTGALAANGTPPGGGKANARSHHGPLGQVSGKIRVAFVRCRRASGDARQECVAKLVTLLEQAKTKLDAYVAEAQEKCADTTPSDKGSAAARAKKLCARLDGVEKRVEQIKTKIDKLIALLQSPDFGKSSQASKTSTDKNLAQLQTALEALP